MKPTFSFQTPSDAEKAKDSIVRLFAKAGCSIASVELNSKTMRASGLSWREVLITFSDSQTVVLRMKLTGDIYQVVVNGKLLPIRRQDEPEEAIGEIATVLDMGRVAWQKRLAKIRIRDKAAPQRGAVVTRITQTRQISARISEKKQLLEDGLAELADIRAKTSALYLV